MSILSNTIVPMLSGKRITLGVTGSIAAYKAADLASKLAQAGAQVDVILTGSGTKFRHTADVSIGHRAARLYR